MAKADAESHLRGRGGIDDFLLNRWNTFRPEREVWTMWDIAMVEAILRPELATAITTGAPIVRGIRQVQQFSDNPRRVTVWTDIDETKMLEDFWQVLDEHATRNTATGRGRR